MSSSSSSSGSAAADDGAVGAADAVAADEDGAARRGAGEGSTAAGSNEDDTDDGGIFSNLFGNMGRTILFYTLIQLLLRSLLDSSPQHATQVVDKVSSASSPSSSSSRLFGNLWRDHQPFEIRVYVSAEEQFRDFYDEDALHFHAKELTYDFAESNHRTLQTAISLPAAALRNETVYAHIYFTKRDRHPDPRSSSYDPTSVIYRRHPLTRYQQIDAKKHKNLLTGKSSKALQVEEGETFLYWKPFLYLRLVHDFSALNPGTSFHALLFQDCIYYLRSLDPLLSISSVFVLPPTYVLWPPPR